MKEALVKVGIPLTSSVTPPSDEKGEVQEAHFLGSIAKRGLKTLVRALRKEIKKAVLNPKALKQVLTPILEDVIVPILKKARITSGSLRMKPMAEDNDECLPEFIAVSEGQCLHIRFRNEGGRLYVKCTHEQTSDIH